MIFPRSYVVGGSERANVIRDHVRQTDFPKNGVLKCGDCCHTISFNEEKKKIYLCSRKIYKKYET